MSTLCLLHSISAGFESQRGADQLACALRGEHQVTLRTIGRNGTYPNPLTAARALRKISSDLIHAFDRPALLAAAMGTRAKLIFSPPADNPNASIRLIRAIAPYRDLQIICPTTTLHRQFVKHGVPVDRCHLIRPGVDFSRIARKRDPDLRQSLGLSTDDIVIFAPGESTRPAAHDLAVWAVSILRVTNRRFCLLLWGKGQDIPRVERLAHNLESGYPLHLATQHLGDDVEMEQLLPAVDLVLCPSDTNTIPTLPIAVCMAASLPIVATATHTHSELLEDRHTALLISKPTPRLLARRLLDLLEDSALRWRLGDMARVEAYEYFSLSRMVDQHRDLYDQIIQARPVSLHQPAPGAGMRFHGRG